MIGSQIAFMVIGGTAFVLLLLSFLFGEIFDFFDGNVEMGEIGTDIDGVSWLSGKVLFAALVGFGAFGLVASVYEIPVALTWLIALLGMLLVGAGTFFLVLKPLAKQQSNSSLSRESYSGLSATVTLPISHEVSGMVTFYDRNGAFVKETAFLIGEVAEVPKGTQVIITSVNPGSVTVALPSFQKEN